MARFRGAIGYAGLEETAPGVQSEVITEHIYTGDLQRAIGRLEPSTQQVNDNVAINNQLSIVADAFAVANISAMRYVKWNGQNWKISSVQVVRPRLIINIGELWNGNTP